MIDDPLQAIAVIVAVAFCCQLIADRMQLPSVLFLLIAGVALSPVLDPDELFGDLLFTGIGLGVAVLLFEGGTSLHWRGLTRGRAVVIRLVSVGALVAWVVGASAAALFLDVSAELAILIGAILIVSGPTVVKPLLRVVRPREPTASILRWEGILIDPVGASLAIVVLDAIIEDRSTGRVIARIATTFVAGAAVGVVAAALLLFLLRRRLVADHLHVPATLAAIIGAFAAADLLRPEAGLLAVTILGMAIVNQHSAPTSHIAEFNENLGSSIVGVLFIILGARVELSEIVDNLGPSLGIIAALVLVARPLSVAASTAGTDLASRDRAFLMALAPRGVVAAAVASLFAFELEHAGIDPGPMVPVVFTVVVGTVAIAGTTARLTARRLRVAQPDPRGVALIGGGHFAIQFAKALNDLEVPTLHIGLSEDHGDIAAGLGQLVYQDRLDSESFPETVRALGIASAVALSGTDHLDAYATERIARVIGSGNLYGLPTPHDEAASGTSHAVARKQVVPTAMTAERVQTLLASGSRFRVTQGRRHPRSGWLTICRVDSAQQITFDPDPSHADESDHLIQFGPGLDPDEFDEP